jgi:hypothetical protein
MLDKITADGAIAAFDSDMPFLDPQQHNSLQAGPNSTDLSNLSISRSRIKIDNRPIKKKSMLNWDKSVSRQAGYK